MKHIKEWCRQQEGKMKGASDRREETYLRPYTLALQLSLRELVDPQWLQMLDPETSTRWGLVRLRTLLWSACRLALGHVGLQAGCKLRERLEGVLRMMVN
jgi:hypothetical protein